MVLSMTSSCRRHVEAQAGVLSRTALCSPDTGGRCRMQGLVLHRFHVSLPHGIQGIGPAADGPHSHVRRVAGVAHRSSRPVLPRAAETPGSAPARHSGIRMWEVRHSVAAACPPFRGRRWFVARGVGMILLAKSKRYAAPLSDRSWALLPMMLPWLVRPVACAVRKLGVVLVPDRAAVSTGPWLMTCTKSYGPQSATKGACLSYPAALHPSASIPSALSL